MAEETKSTLLQVNLSLDDAIQEMAAYQQKIDDISIAMQTLTAQYKNGEVTREQYNAEMIRMKETQKAYRKEMGELSRVTQNQIVSQQKYAGTLKGMCAELSVAKDKLRAMKVTDPGWEEQREYVEKLNEKIKEIEQSYGVFQRDVGHYRTGMEKTKESIAETVAQMRELIAAHKEDSPEMEKASEQLENYNNQLAAQGREGIDAMTQGLGGLVGMLGFLSKAFADDSVEAAKMQELIQKLGVAMTVLGIAMKVYQAAEKKGLIQKIAMNLQIKKATTNLLAEAAAETGSTAATVAHTAAQEALNKSMLANPIGLIVAAVVALIAAIVALVTWLLKSTDAQKAANEAMKQYEEQCRQSDLALAQLEANEAARAINVKKRYNDEIKQMISNGATKEQIDKKKEEMEKELLDVTIAAAKEKQKEAEKEMKAAKRNYEAQKALLVEIAKKKGLDAKKTKEQMQATDEAYKSYIQHLNEMNAAIGVINDAEAKKVEMTYTSGQSAADKAYSRAQARLAHLDKLYQESYKRRYQFSYDYNKSAEENEREKWRLSMTLEEQLFNRYLKDAKDKIALDRKYGKITQAEAKERLAELASEQKTHDQQLAEEIAQYERDILATAIQAAGGVSLDQQLQLLKDKYDDARKTIKESFELTEEEKTFYLTQLAERQAAEEKDIRIKNEKEISDRIKSIVEARYEDDMRAFSANATDHIQLEIDQLNEIIARKKKAGQKTLDDEAHLAALGIQLRASALDQELQMKWNNEKAKYQATKDYLQKEIALLEDGTAQKAYLEQQLAEVTAQYHQQKLASFEEYSSSSMEALSAMSSLFNSLESKDLQTYEADNNAKKKSLDKQLKAGLISQEKYDKQTEQLDEELDKKKAEIARKQAIRDKAMSAMQIAINTAAAIMRIWAEVPKADFGVSTGVLTALAATTGAIQLAAVLAEPLPQARIGGLVQGGTHEQGGVLVNTEGGERIISKDASKAFPELLNLISYIGKNSSIPDTGYAAAALASGSGNGVASGSIDYDLLAEKIGSRISEALAANPPHIAIDEYESARATYAKIVDSAKQ